MEKFYWNPSIEDRVNMLHTMWEDDGLSMDDVYALVSRFPSQPMDFFGAVRSRTVDAAVLGWLKQLTSARCHVWGGALQWQQAKLQALSVLLLPIAFLFGSLLQMGRA